MKLNLLLAALTLSLPPLARAAEGPTENAENLIILKEEGVQNLKLETVLVEESDFERSVFAIGRLEAIPSEHSVVSTRIAGRVSRLDVIEGDFVEKGQVVGTLESRQPGNPPPSIELIAPRSGLVIKSHITVGQPVEPTNEIMDISDRRRLWAVANIPEQRAPGIQIGSKATLSFPALGEATFSATLSRFATEADRETGTVQGIFEIANPEGKLQPGMRAEFHIVVSSRENVLSVPEQAVQGDPSARVVYAKHFELPNTFIKVPVVLGEQSGGRYEVLQGLFPGDEVVTRGSYSLGYVGGASGGSLKEALDAAHGHEHAEDGSELTEADKKEAHDHDHGPDGEHESAGAPAWLGYYALGSTILLIFCLQLLWNAKRKEARHA
ncbi:MAG: efflux RND transporter periplasmic adaptor subunit [Verrucomicrobiales bacterium]